MPVLAFGDAWFADVDRHLTAVESMHKFCKRTSVINIHLNRKRDFLLWKIAQVCTVQLLSKGVLWDLRDHEGLWLVCEAVDEVNDFTKSYLVGDWTIAIATFEIPGRAGDDGRNNINTVLVATVLITLQCINHLLNEVVNVEKFHLY